MIQIYTFGLQMFISEKGSPYTQVLFGNFAFTDKTLL